MNRSLSEQMFGIFDPTLKLSFTVPGYGYDKIFGANHDDMVAQANVVIHSENHSMALTGNRFVETYKMPLQTSCTATRTAAPPFSPSPTAQERPISPASIWASPTPAEKW